MENLKPIYIKDYNYPLPEERIAKYPLKQRDRSKLLVYRDGQVSEDVFRNVGDYIATDSLLVYNNTRVIQARLRFRKTRVESGASSEEQGVLREGARIEVFCLEPIAPHDYQLSLTSTEGCTWKCMIGNAKKWKEGAISLKVAMKTAAADAEKTVILSAYKESQMGNTYAVRFEWDDADISFAEILDAVGELPIPPYLNRKTEESDKTTYQTVYSHVKGSVAAPTAGLHFTEEVLEDLHQRGIHTTELTLHVGAGTFLPVKTADANEHTMHTEIIAVPRAAIEAIRERLGRIVAVGTTSMRTLESLYFIGRRLAADEQPTEQLHVGQFEPYEDAAPMSSSDALQAILDYLDATGQQTLHAETQIMIKPGYEFRVVDQLITNFHQPQSTLLLLVSAFVGGDWKTIYKYALGHEFRFLSYGDSSILTRAKTKPTEPLHMIDTHCHIDEEAFARDREAVIERQKQAGVEAIVVPGVDRGSIESVMRVCEEHPGYCFAVLGLHPEEVKQDWQEHYSEVEQAIREHRDQLVAIGELGLDYHWDTTYKAEQQEVLRRQLRLAQELALPIIVHNREATEDTLSILREAQAAGELRGVMHCFNGSKETAEEVLRMGLYLGIGGVLTFKNCKLAEHLSAIRREQQSGDLGRAGVDIMDRIVLETDAPYMAPVPHRGERNESRLMIHVAERLSEVLGCTTLEVVRRTTENARRLFELKK